MANTPYKLVDLVHGNHSVEGTPYPCNNNYTREIRGNDVVKG